MGQLGLGLGLVLWFTVSFYVYSMDSKSFWIAIDVFVY